ncbi:MAG: hypothetical protein FXF54_02025 [Kosmotoga sp.]|nr:MAG: hypothetical protein FXF54_02025 [Kosmotoga sp.]
MTQPATLMNILAYTKNQKNLERIEKLTEEEQEVARELEIHPESFKVPFTRYALGIGSDLLVGTGITLILTGRDINIGSGGDPMPISFIFLGNGFMGDLAVLFLNRQALFRNADGIESRVNSYINAQEERNKRIFEAKKAKSINPNSKNNRLFSINKTKICIHSIKMVDDYTLLDISITNNYNFRIRLTQENLYLLSAEKIISLFYGAELSEKYSNAMLFCYPLVKEIPANTTERGYLVFKNDKNEKLKLVIGISEESTIGYKNVGNLYSLNIDGLEEAERLSIPLKPLKVAVNYYNYFNHLQVSLQNTSNKTIRAFAIKATFYNDFGYKVRDLYTRFVAQKLSFKPWETKSSSWVMSEDTITRAEIYIDEVIFTDGTKWKAE